MVFVPGTSYTLLVTHHRLIGIVSVACLALSACIIQTGSGSNLPNNQDPQQGNPNQPHPPFASDPSVGDLLQFFPADTAILGGADFEKVRSSEHWSKYKHVLVDQLDNLAVAIFRDQCGIDIVEVASWAVVAFPPQQNNPDDTVIVMSSSVPWTQLQECTDRLGFQFEQDGDISIYRHINETLYLRWLSETAFMFTAAPDQRGLYDLGQGKGADGSLLADLISNIDTTAMLWMVADTDKARDHFGGGMRNLNDPVGMFGAGELPGGFSARVGLSYDNPQSARTTATLLAQQIDIAKQQPMAAQFLQNVQMSVEGSNVMIDAALAKPEVDLLLSMTGGLH